MYKKLLVIVGIIVTVKVIKKYNERCAINEATNLFRRHMERNPEVFRKVREEDAKAKASEGAKQC